MRPERGNNLEDDRSPVAQWRISNTSGGETNRHAHARVAGALRGAEGGGVEEDSPRKRRTDGPDTGLGFRSHQRS